jgi:hypothetical protein
MRDIFQYFDLITNWAEASGAESVELDFDSAGSLGGQVEGVFYFYDGSRLEFTEVVAIANQQPEKLSYRYQYICGETINFRYDNSDHHRKLSNFPHHKHVGRKIVSAIEPTLGQVLDEVRDLLQTTQQEPALLPKRRRQRKS